MNLYKLTIHVRHIFSGTKGFLEQIKKYSPENKIKIHISNNYNIKISIQLETFIQITQ